MPVYTQIAGFSQGQFMFFTDDASNRIKLTERKMILNADDAGDLLNSLFEFMVVFSLKSTPFLLLFSTVKPA
jgi:hypothetical protein